MKNLSYFLLMLALIPALASCDKDSEEPEEPEPTGSLMIYDYAPLYLQLAAYDDKHDLFDPSYEGNICESVSVTYKGEEYFYVPPTQQSPNKSKISLNHFVATFMGMYMWSRAGAEEWMPYTMQFGDFESTQNYSNEKFIVKWPDGKVDVVVWSLVYKPKPRQKATFELTGTLNGKKVDYPLFIHRKF